MEGLRSFWSPGCFGQNAPRASADRAERAGAQPRSSRRTGRRGWSGAVIGAMIHPPSAHCAAAPRASPRSCCARRAEPCEQHRAGGASSLGMRVHAARAAGAERASDIAAPTRTRGRATEARMDAAWCIIMQWSARLLAPLLPRAARRGRRSGRRRRRRQLRRPQQLMWRLRQQPTYGPRGHPVFHGAACARGRPARTL